MKSVPELLALLEREHVLSAIKQLNAGASTHFAESTKFDLIYRGKRYAPKEVAGLALEVANNQRFAPADFKGGNGSGVFRALGRCGFTIIPKSEPNHSASLVSTLSEILHLQTKYDSKNTEEMQRRGFLIRTVLRDLIYENIERFEPLFSARGYECAAEGSDGIGRKAMSAWTRLYDPEMSPSATQGWYLVLHFSSKGDFFFLTLGCGATTFVDGSLADVDPEVLSKKIAWAKDCFVDHPQLLSRFSDVVQLNGNHLSSQFEKSIAFAKRYQLNNFNESTFWSDFSELSRMLVDIYESDRLGKIPFTESPEVREYQSQLSLVVRPKSKVGSGQGRFLSQAEKTAVEKQAMSAARSALEVHGFTNVEDKSAKESYDFFAQKDGVDWFVEVKGTTSAVANSFLLTANELALHQKHKGRTVLAIVYDIDLDRSSTEPSASGGRLSIDIPWNPDVWEFKPTAYSALRRK